jgi:uncharacterized protein YjiS (DUF1127 family)
MAALTLPARRSGRAELERQAGSLTDALRRTWREHRTYRATLAALTALDVREREDIGLAGADLEAIARKAALGPR